jgi:small subunit ribosomal protein S1
MEEKEEIMNLIDKSLEKLKEGSIVEGKVVGILGNEVFVNIGAKSEGTVKIEEFGSEEDVKIGQEYSFFLEKIIEEEGIVILSKKKADFIKVWDDIERSCSEKIPLRGRVKKIVKGGVLVDISGVEGFLPLSHLDIKKVENVEKFLNQEIEVRVTKFNQVKNAIVVSRRLVIEDELRRKKEEVWNTIKEGQIIEGEVKTITDFGIFVDIGGVDGLVHIADLSWGRIDHPSEVVKIGEKIKVKVLGVDKEEGHLTLGVRQLTPSPWETVEERYYVGKRVRGKVTSLTEYGAFVELEPGIEGLIHISEMSWTHIKTPLEILKVGETVEVVVLKIDKEEEKISLGLRQTKPNPWKKVAKKYSIGSIVEGVVKSFTKFAVFVELEEGVEGILQVEDLSWDEYIEHPGDVLTKRQKIKCKILEIDPDAQKLRLGVKQLEKDPFIVLKENMEERVRGRIKEIVSKGVIVKVIVGKHKVQGIVPFSHLVRQVKRRIEEKYKIGEEIILLPLQVDERRRKAVFSEKNYYEREERKEWEEYLKRKK